MYYWDFSPSSEDEYLSEKTYFELQYLKKCTTEYDQLISEQECKKLLDISTQLADKGVIDGMYYMGRLYDKVLSACFDQEKAKECFEKASDKGHRLAKYELAKKFRYDNPGRAYSLLCEITDEADNVYAHACYMKGELLWGDKLHPFPDYPNAIKNYEVAGYRKHYKAALKVGKLYEEGFREDNKTIVFRNIVNAGYYMKIAYENEPIITIRKEATFRYARMLNEGSGVTQNYSEAFKLFYEAACARNGEAMVELANIFYKSVMFDPDYEMAYLWLLISQSFQCYNYSNQRDGQRREVEVLLSPKKIMELQEKAPACVAKINSSKSALVTSGLIPSATEYLAEHSWMSKPEAQADSAPPEDQAEEVDENKARDTKYLFKQKGQVVSDAEKDAIEKEFKAEAVTFRIWIDKDIREMKGNQRIGEDNLRNLRNNSRDKAKIENNLEFDTLRVKYEGYDLQAMYMDDFSKLRMCHSARNLLVRLAVARHNMPEDRYVKFEREVKIKKKQTEIIEKAADADVSAINTMFKKLFPFREKSSGAINKAAGELKIKLEIASPEDATVSGFVQNAYDYDDLLHEKQCHQ
jgi:TPR repeat protein